MCRGKLSVYNNLCISRLQKTTAPDSVPVLSRSLRGIPWEYLSRNMRDEHWLQVKHDGASVVVQIIDICSSCHENEISLLQPQLYSLSSGSSAQTGANDIRASYRQVRLLMLLTGGSPAAWHAVHTQRSCGSL